MSTLSIPPAVPSPREDAIQLYKAFKGLGSDTGKILFILAHRDATHRALIGQEYKTMYAEDLLKRLSKELSGKLEESLNYKNAVLLWMHDPASRDAIIVKQALSSGSTKLAAATEVICSRTPSQIQTIKQLYHSMFKVHLEHDIKSKASGDHEKLLLAYISAPRSEGLEVNKQKAAEDAKALYKAGEKKLGTDEKTFIKIFSERSRAEMVAIDFAYHDMYRHSLNKAVKKETSGLFEQALLTILRCAKNPAKYFAKVLHESMEGLGTDDTTLVRVIVTRTEIDLSYIKTGYSKKYKKTLNASVESETSGDYKTFLLHLLGPNI